MTNVGVPLQELDDQTLTPVVARALNTATITLGQWQATKIHENYNPLTEGVYRVTGTAHAGARTLPWSVILKIVRWWDMSANFSSDWANDPTHFFYWKREALVFQSGILHGLQHQLAPPTCYGVLDVAGDRLWLWLEDVQETQPGRWNLDRHILAARHFGQFNGAFAQAAALPTYPWLSQHFLRQWLAFCRAWQSDAILGDASVWSDSAVHGVLPSNLVPRILALLRDADVLLAALEALPQTLCHLDTDRRNLFSRSDHDGQAQTVVIDWGFLGLAAVGEDLGNQVGGELFHLAVRPSEATKYADAALTAYLDGLREMQWHGQIEDVGLAMRLHQLHYLGISPLIVQDFVREGFIQPWMRAWMSEHDATPAEAFRQWGDALMFLVTQAEAAHHDVVG